MRTKISLFGLQHYMIDLFINQSPENINQYNSKKTFACCFSEDEIDDLREMSHSIKRRDFLKTTSFLGASPMAIGLFSF